MKPFYTYSGREINLDTLQVSDIFLEDIATALSRICRFGGHSRKFYSVAEHSVFVSQMCGPGFQLAGLLHDASEAYVGDLIGPIKEEPYSLGYKVLEDQIQRVIEMRFGLPEGILEAEEIKRHDTRMFEIERDALVIELVPAIPLFCFEPAQARLNFLSTFYNLGGLRCL